MLTGRLQKLVGRAQRFWNDEASLRARLRNIGHLLTGNLFGSIVGMLGFVVTARALGPVDYGVLALIYSYTRAVERLISFQSWQPLIKYGAELTGKEHHDDYRALLKFGLVVDVSAAILAYLVAIGFALLFGPAIGLQKETIWLVVIYSSVLLIQVNGFPTAVMRLAGRFRIMAYGSVAGGFVRLLLCLIGLLFGGGLLFFVFAWTASQILGSITRLVIALIELNRQGVRRLLSAPLKGVRGRFKGLLGFTVGSNLELTIRSSANEFDTLLVGWFTDPAGAGLYHMAKRLGRVVLQIGVQVQAVLYPDIARLWAKRDLVTFRRTVRQTEIMLAAFGVAVVCATILFIKPALDLLLGAQFAAAAPLAIVQMIAVAIMLSGSVVRSALLAMGKQIAVLKVVTVSTIAFHVTAVAMIYSIGAMGANIANVILGVVWLVGLLYLYRSALREHNAGVPAAAPPPGDAAMPELG